MDPKVYLSMLAYLLSFLKSIPLNLGSLNRLSFVSAHVISIEEDFVT